MHFHIISDNIVRSLSLVGWNSSAYNFKNVRDGSVGRALAASAKISLFRNLARTYPLRNYTSVIIMSIQNDIKSVLFAITINEACFIYFPMSSSVYKLLQCGREWNKLYELLNRLYHFFLKWTSATMFVIPSCVILSWYLVCLM